MDYKHFFVALKEKKLPNVLLFDGEEEYVKQSALAQLRQAYVPEGLEALNESLLPEKAGNQQIMEAVETLPFMSDKRLVILRDHPLFLNGGKSSEDEAGLIDILKSVPESTIALFYIKGNADMRKKLPKFIASIKGDVRFAYLNEREQASWVSRQMGAFQKKIEPKAVELLLYRAGPQITRLEGEVAKLINYLGERETAQREDVELIVTNSAENNVFEMLDMLLSGNGDRALSIHEDLRMHGESGFGILALLSSQVRRMLHMRALLQDGSNRVQAAQAMGITSYAASRVAESAARHPLERLRQMEMQCIDTDYAIKSGALREEMAISILMFKFLGLDA